MGDRAVIGFRADADAIPVFLYSHWGGSDRYVDTQRAILAAKPRWNDPAYATRIAISQIIENYWSEETGFGISAGHNSFSEPDYDDVILVDWVDLAVYVVAASDSTKVQTKMEFSDFLEMEDLA